MRHQVASDASVSREFARRAVNTASRAHRNPQLTGYALLLHSIGLYLAVSENKAQQLAEKYAPMIVADYLLDQARRAVAESPAEAAAVLVEINRQRLENGIAPVTLDDLQGSAAA